MEPLPAIDEAILSRLDAFVTPALANLAGRGRRPLAQTYVRGLVGACVRKNVERLAREARGVAAAPAYERRMRAMLADEDWRHSTVMWAGAHRLFEHTDGWCAYTLDDTALLKQGARSVGVQNQYAGCVGGLANCQILVTLGVAQAHVSAPCAAQLYLSKEWCNDSERRAECHVPTSIDHRPKWQLGLELIRQTHYEGMPRLPVLADSAYGDVVELRRALQSDAVPYLVCISLRTTVWPAGLRFGPRTSVRRGGRAPTRWSPDKPCAPCDVTTFARTLPAEAWHTVCWREGSRGAQLGRFAAVQVRPANGWQPTGGVPADALLAEEWLLVHWPQGEAEPTKAWLSNLPPTTPLEALVRLARLRWRIERDYREAKGIAGLDHYEGRTWHGLHHHVALVVLAQQFLANERHAALRATADLNAAPAAFSP